MKITYEIIIQHRFPDILRIRIEPLWGEILTRDILLDIPARTIGYFDIIFEEAKKELFEFLSKKYYKEIYPEKKKE